MSDFSTISFDKDFAMMPQEARYTWYQSKDMPEHESESACIDGNVLVNGLFVRSDSKWNPSLHGWIRLIAEFGSYKFVARFERGYIVEVLSNVILPSKTEWADDSQNDWQDIRSIGT